MTIATNARANAEAARRGAEACANAIEHPKQLRRRAFKRLVIACMVTGAVASVAAYALIGLVVEKLLCN